MKLGVVAAAAGRAARLDAAAILGHDLAGEPVGAESRDRTGPEGLAAGAPRCDELHADSAKPRTAIESRILAPFFGARCYGTASDRLSR
jgi:hypothetical protein